MISRRNIRVKVMQTLYSTDASKQELSPGEARRTLDKKIDVTSQLFAYLIYFMTEVARYVETDARKKANKHLPSAQDLAMNTKLAGNEMLWRIREDASFSAAVGGYHLKDVMDDDLLKKVYQRLVATPEYIEYIEEPSRDKKTEKRMLEFIFNTLMLPDEDVITHLEEKFINWDDDAEMMQAMVHNYMNKFVPQAFNVVVGKEKLQFAHELLQTVIQKEAYLRELITPKLNNWDADRIAALDLILLEMGVCEFLYFETIPTKVTINEYIDLAKAYSTPQSGQFVNGLLDSLNKELSAAGKIEKKTYKNSTL